MGEVDARWPGRPTASDGSIGDAAHAARPSEHNPDRDADPMPAGYVSAVDITKASAAQMGELLGKLTTDPRVWYVIHNGRIYSRKNGFRGQRYTGPNPHIHHMHVSLMQTATAASSTAPWHIAPVAPEPPAPGKPKPVELKGRKPGERVLRAGATGRDVAFLQRWLGVASDGDFGPVTEKAVKRYQRLRGLAQDGIVGPRTWAFILTGKGAA